MKLRWNKPLWYGFLLTNYSAQGSYGRSKICFWPFQASFCQFLLFSYSNNKNSISFKYINWKRVKVVLGIRTRGSMMLGANTELWRPPKNWYDISSTSIKLHNVATPQRRNLKSHSLEGRFSLSRKFYQVFHFQRGVRVGLFPGIGHLTSGIIYSQLEQPVVDKSLRRNLAPDTWL